MISRLLSSERYVDQFCDVCRVVEHRVEDDEAFGAVVFALEADYRHGMACGGCWFSWIWLGWDGMG